MSIRIKKYKTCILILWAFCILLYVILLYGKNRNNSLAEKNKLAYSYNLSETSITKTKIEKENSTLHSFKKFLLDLNSNLYYKSVEIKDNIISVDLIISDKTQYYNIVKKIEDSHEYSIVYLSPLYDKDNILNFKFMLEVKL